MTSAPQDNGNSGRYLQHVENLPDLMILMTLQMELPGGFGPLNTHNLAKTLGISEISNTTAFFWSRTMAPWTRSSFMIPEPSLRLASAKMQVEKSTK